MRKAPLAGLILVTFTLPTAALAVSEPRLVADLATVPSPFEGSKPHGLATIGSHVLFAAQPDDHADRLFRSDGTAEGTIELLAPCAALAPGRILLVHAGATRAFYSIYCTVGEAALWASDGTAAGTVQLLPAGEFQPTLPFYRAPGWAEEGGSTLFLQGGNYSTPLELWRTDATAAGTLRLAVLSDQTGATGALARQSDGDFQLLVWEHFASLAVWESDGTVAGTGVVSTIDLGTTSFGVRSFASTASGIFFMLERGMEKELWHSDGTDVGTLRLASFERGVWDDLVANGDAIYFSASAGGAAGIWRSDATAATTRRIAALENLVISPASFTFLGDRIYCLGFAEDWSSGSIYSSPTTGGNPEELLQQCVGGFCYPLYENLWLANVGDRLVFSRREPGVSTVWSSDGVFGGTPSEIAPLCDGADCSWSGSPALIVGGELLFVRQLFQPEAMELWRSGGTADSTFRLAGPLPFLPLPAAGGESPFGALPGDGGWLFAAGDEVHGQELWRVEVEEDSAVLVADLRLDRPHLQGLEPIGLIEPDLVFSLQNPDSTRTLYRHRLDGAAVAPFLSLPVIQGRYGSRNPPPTWRVAGDSWYFFESDFDGNQGSEEFAQQVWRYDPVSGETRALFPDLVATGVGALAHDLFAAGADSLLLGSRDAELHPTIYRLQTGSGAISKLLDLPAAWARSIGRSGKSWFLLEEESRLVVFDLDSRARKVVSNAAGGPAYQPVVLTSGALFEVAHGAEGEEGRVELRQSDGTVVGTREIARWPSAADGCVVLRMPSSAAGDPALFVVQTSCDGTTELWITDGSAARTRRLRTFAGDVPLVERGGVAFRGERYFLTRSQDVLTGLPIHSIWKTDGTPQGTVAVVALPASSDFGYPSDLGGAAGSAAIYFPWIDEAHGIELWRSDGTASGTSLLADLEPGPLSSSPFPLWPLGDQVLFTAWTATTGKELWQVDGGLEAPQLVADLYPGPEGSAPLVLASSDERTYLFADDGLVGREIWQVGEPSVAPCVPSATTLCMLEGRFRARAVRRDFTGRMAEAGAVAITSDSGFFWFFDAGNPEVMVKLVDACDLPGFENFWAYSTGLTNVEVELEVVDTVSGERGSVRTALGEAYGPLFDSGSFEVCDESIEVTSTPVAPPPVAPAPPHTPASPVLALLDGRFEATADWETRDGRSGAGEAVAISGDSGYFWFFAPAIVEVLVKMVDACGYPGFDNFWVFAGGLTDVSVDLAIRDTWSGRIVSHRNLQGAPFTPLLATGDLRVCETPQP